MRRSKQPSGERIRTSTDLTASDVLAWLAALAASDRVSSAPVQASLPAKAKEGSAPRTARRRPRPGGEYLGKSA
jgi:hypothetical protein